MLTADFIREIYTYHYAMYGRIWESIMRLSDAQFVEPFDYSVGSVRNHMVHLCSVEQRWFARMRGVDLPPRLDYTNYPTRTITRDLYQRLYTKHTAFLDTLDDAFMTQTLTYDVSRYDTARHNAMWEILWHVVNHGTDHRAQILAILDRMGAPTFEHDYMLYLWDRKA